jgi:hypothetical protein
VGDEDKLAAWLAEEVCPVELSEERLREVLVARCRVERIEPPAPSRLERVLGTARAAAELRFTAQVSSRLTTKAVAGLEALVAETDAEGAGESGLLAEIKADPGKRNIETLVIETEKLARVKAICLPAELFTESSEKLVDAWRARAARLYPSDLRASPAPVRLTLLAALCWARQTEIIDGLVDLLITLVHKVDVTAERKVGGEMLDDLRRVRGKQGLLFALAEAALDHPDDTVRDALYPVVSEATLKDLVAEAKANDTAFRQRVRTVLRSSYSSHYRRMLPKLLAALEFRCNNTTYRPVMDALDLLRRYTDRPARDRFCDHGEKVPVEGVVPREWADAVVDDDSRVERIPYELCVLRSLREAIRRREVYIAGATRWRNPEDDLPADFDANRDVHYAAIRQPLDPSAFVADLKARLGAALTRLDQGIAAGTTGGVKITTRRGEPWIHVPPTPAVPEPTNLLALKAEVERRWVSSTCWTSSRRPTSMPASPRSSPPSPPGRSPTGPFSAGACCWCCSAWAPTLASATSPAGRAASPRPCCAGCGGCSSTVTTSAGRSPAWSTPPSPSATRPCGDRGRPVRRTRRSSARGRRTS